MSVSGNEIKSIFQIILSLGLEKRFLATRCMVVTQEINITYLFSKKETSLQQEGSNIFIWKSAFCKIKWIADRIIGVCESGHREYP